MSEIENLLQPHMDMTLHMYLDNSKRQNDGVWGTDIELLAESSWLDTDIYVYTQVGGLYKWPKFSKSMLGLSHPQNTGAVYVQHTNGVHYDVVLDVGPVKPYNFNQRKRAGQPALGTESTVNNEPVVKKIKYLLSKKWKPLQTQSVVHSVTAFHN